MPLRLYIPESSARRSPFEPPPPSPVPAVPSFILPKSFFGGLFIEVFVGGILYGITTLQTFIYFQKYPEDGRFLKYYYSEFFLLVARSVFRRMFLILQTDRILDTLHTAFCLDFVYSYLITNYGNAKYFIHTDWSRSSSRSQYRRWCKDTISAESGSVRRCDPPLLPHLLDHSPLLAVSNRNWFLACIIASLVVSRVAFGMGSTILTYYLSGWVSFRQHKAATVTVSGGLASVAAVDVMVTTSITWYLRKKRSEVQESAKSKVDMIMLYAVNTGALTATASVITCILYAVRRDSLVFLRLVEVSGKLYANSFLGSLNARAHIRGKGNKQYSHESSGNTYRGPQVPKVEVFQQTLVSKDTVDRDYDNEYAMSPVKGGDLV
ncbi:hypothetical protein GSI_00188 [Ganoderma sinense ZZ0214-1]|uniref:DUF6534 domain-containing protein n=1 Tax=Ganoderma sinense ZZ0214-1 TaxID=1077348 RepID=A0A2G8SRV2_9APHY|nr:hypothetical protein GSI_00188 [Ganoderma sinense ZZ0214-1]